MTCLEFEDRLHARLDAHQSLDEPEVEAHLRSCPECAAFVRSWYALTDAFDVAREADLLPDEPGGRADAVAERVLRQLALTSGSDPLADPELAVSASVVTTAIAEIATAQRDGSQSVRGPRLAPWVEERRSHSFVQVLGTTAHAPSSRRWVWSLAGAVVLLLATVGVWSRLPSPSGLGSGVARVGLEQGPGSVTPVKKQVGDLSVRPNRPSETRPEHTTAVAVAERSPLDRVWGEMRDASRAMAQTTVASWEDSAQLFWPRSAPSDASPSVAPGPPEPGSSFVPLLNDWEAPFDSVRDQLDRAAEYLFQTLADPGPARSS